MSSLTSYPLAWPPHFPRTQGRDIGRFNTTISGALANVQTSLHRFSKDSGKELDDLIISSNVTLSIRRPEDPGVALWFLWDGLRVCIPIDRYTTVSSNLQAIHHIIQARRTELKHGSLALVKATFQGFLLAAPTGQHWRDVLGVSERASPEDITDAYRRLASKHHPDRGGDSAVMARINTAFQEAQYA